MIVSGGSSGWVAMEEGAGGVICTLRIPNEPKRKPVAFKKVDIAAPFDSALAGAVFDPYRVVDGERADTPLYTGMTSGADGMLACGGETAFYLRSGTYELVETAAPQGYYEKDPVTVTVTVSDVTYDEGTLLSEEGTGILFDEEAGINTLLISNTTGVKIPGTGGPGTAPLRALGAALMVGAGAILVFMTRRRPLR